MTTKVCNDCKIAKNLSEFSPRKFKTKIGTEPYCRPCNALRSKTPRRLAGTQLKNQQLSSKRRGHPMPAYTVEELYDWMLAQPHFEEMYAAWKASDFESRLKPSVDRLDDYAPYTFDNIQLLTWEGNNAAFRTKQKNGETGKVLKPVIQMDLEGNFIKEYASVSLAAQALNGSHGAIAQVCRGEPNSNGLDARGKSVSVTRRTAYGFKWRYK